MAARKDHTSPLWDKRRWYFERYLMFCAGEVIFCSVGALFGWLSPEEISALAGLFAAVDGAAAASLAAYMGIAEYGSVKKGTVVTEEIEAGPPKTIIKTTEHKPPPLPDEVE